MDILYPLPSLTSPEVARESSVTVLINHVVDREDRRGFLDALKGFLEEFEKFAGTMGCKVFEQEEGGKVRVTMLQRFDSAKDHEAWLKSEAFRRWEGTISRMRPTVEPVRGYSGMEALFAAERKAPDAPPRWKMAIVLLIAVFPLSVALSVWFGQALANIPPVTGALITSPVMVFLMTYVLVPILTKVFARWLEPSR
jgi:uncharacterized protein